MGRGMMMMMIKTHKQCNTIQYNRTIAQRKKENNSTNNKHHTDSG